jgi:hypothetical protein
VVYHPSSPTAGMVLFGIPNLAVYCANCISKAKLSRKTGTLIASSTAKVLSDGMGSRNCERWNMGQGREVLRRDISPLYVLPGLGRTSTAPTASTWSKSILSEGFALISIR